DCEVIVGKKVSLADIQPLSEDSGEAGRFTVWGEIFEIEEFTTRQGRHILSISVTDGTESISVKLYDEKSGEIRTKLKTSDALVVNGDVAFDRYSSDYIMNPKNINMMKVTAKIRRDEAAEKRLELHLHTNMSAMDAIPSVRDAVNLAYSLGHRAVAITDHGVLQSFPEAAEAYKAIKREDKAADFKVIYGVEAYYSDDTAANSGGESEDAEPANWSPKNTRPYHMILLVKNMTGLKNLYKLVSVSHLEYFYRRPIMPLSEIIKHREGLIIGSACENGEVFRAVVQGRTLPELEQIAEKYDYLEIQPLANNRFMVRESSVADESVLMEFNRTVIELGMRLSKPVVATCDVHFLKEKDSIYRTILMSGQGYEDSDSGAPLYYRTTDEMLEEFAYLDDETRMEVVVHAPNRIADMVDGNIKPIPDGTYTPQIEGSEELLRELAERAMAERFGPAPPELVCERMNKELGSILKYGFAVLYVIAQKLVSKSEQDGYYVGSRGSVGSSFIAFLVGISDVNPLPAHYLCRNCKYVEFADEAGSGYDLDDKNCPVCGTLMRGDGHNIPFETFLGFDGDKVPDIDLNFSSEYQGRAHRYTEELFGRDRVFKAGTISALKERTSFGFVKKYLEENSLVVSRADENRLVSGCTGVKRTTGQHPGGMVVIPKDYEIADFTPVQHPADSRESGVVTTHFDIDSLKDTLLKLDILGHDVPTRYKYLEELTGIKMADVPMNDRTVYSLFTSIEPLGIEPGEIGTAVGTLGIPEMGTQFVEQILLESGPQNFSDLLQVSGLSHGTDVWRNNAQHLIKEGICTISEVIGTRDSVMVYLTRMGVDPKIAFEITEFTRRGRADTQFTEELEQTVKSCGVEDWYIESCKQIKYLFPKAHAAAYVMSAIRICWFKLYYPLEYYASCFTVRGKDIDQEAAFGGAETAKRLLNEYAKKTAADQKRTPADEDNYVTLQITAEMLCRGYGFLPVDLFKSDSEAYLVEDGKLRLPFISLKGIGESAARSLKEAADAGGYISAEEMLSHPGITQSLIDTLETCGALGNLPKTSQLSLF
ncbi:MAG: PolC-type DNA polymerase III, partial [Oscillospiraceae bacterium]|nr:PolC-type DNA polymerase III [Oscillospiraceae bacterium]